MKHMKILEERLAALEEQFAELEIPEEYRHGISIFQLPEDQAAYNKYQAWFQEHPDPRKEVGINCIIIKPCPPRTDVIFKDGEWYNAEDGRKIS
jgi:hypothetical protein